MSRRSDLIEDLLRALRRRALRVAICSEGKYRTLFMMFPDDAYDFVRDEVQEVISRRMSRKGEVITCEIGRGWVIDMGRPSLDVKRGFYIEAYDYEATSVLFLRVYFYTDGERSWISLYVDENPETPWWSASERGQGGIR